MTTGFYSLIQYCPDLSRQEAANLGVVLFCPGLGYLRTKTTSKVRRLRKFFGQDIGDAAQLRLIRSSIESRFAEEKGRWQNADDLAKFAAIQANGVRVTPPRRVLVERPDDVLHNLFTRLVESGSRRRTADLLETLESEFSLPPYEPLIRRKVEIVVPAIRRAVVVPFGYQNGRFNLIKPARFVAGSATELLQVAGGLAWEGDLLYQTPNDQFGDVQLVVVGQFTHHDNDGVDAVRRHLTQNHTRFYRFEERQQLFADIRANGKPIQRSPVASGFFPTETDDFSG